MANPLERIVEAGLQWGTIAFGAEVVYNTLIKGYEIKEVLSNPYVISTVGIFAVGGVLKELWELRQERLERG